MPSLESDPAQLTREFRLERVRMHIAHCVQQRRHLPLAGFDNPRVRMTRGSDAKRCGQIEIFFPLRVPNVRTFCALPNNRPRTGRFDERDVTRFVAAQEVECVLGLCFQ